MKKYLFVVMSGILLFGLPSCGGNDKIVEESPQETEKAEDTPHRTGDEFIGMSDKDINDLDISFSDSIPEDVTGNWRLATLSDSADIAEYAKSYYNSYFKSDDEIHCIVNFTLNTTTIISKMDFADGVLLIEPHEYVDGEEHSAKEMPSGTSLGQYWVYLDNGDIEKIE